MASATEIEKFADCLRELKERSGRSYGALARRLHVSTSTLHRYCNGDAVPADYAPVERLARLCGATPDELVGLHRRWLLADAARRTVPGRGSRSARGAAPSRDAVVSAPEADSPGSAATADAAPAPRAGGDAGGDEPGPTRTPTGTSAGAPAESDGPSVAEGEHAGAEGGSSIPDDGPAPADAPGSDTPTAPQPVEPTAGADAPDGTRRPARPRAGRDLPTRLAAGLAARLRGRRAVAWSAVGAVLAAAVIGVAAAASSPPDGTGGRGAASGTERGRAVAPGATAPTRTGGPSGQPQGERGGAGRESAAERRTDAGRRGQAEEKRPEPTTAAPDRTPSPGGSSRAGAPSAGATPDGDAGRGGAHGGPGAGAGTPLTLSTRSHVWENGCDHRYLVDREPAEVAPPPVEQDAPGWARAHGAVHGGTTIVEVTVAGRSSRAVVLRGLQVRVVGRQAPLAWPAFAMENGCGGSLTPRAFSVDLDMARPLAKPTDGYDGQRPLPAVRFPYRVSATDPEVLRVNARTVACDCQWYLELDWVSGDRQGTVRIDDGGRPFRTSGLKGRPEYGYWSSDGGWLRDGG
ncbi:transcriptional regulator [Streptomyces buecherae]|uniref:Helix-turn-helix domain-containing protein n=1 Tax=Streptomyces buecherae TaxID=2763006 RepID=A0A7H8N370_9ACTN|nr:helix-turn-helix transcriptional regulator [Streptomyces buecherae]QKW48957.1 helix-turn-helix domain-containing protein [Streptomyces buecherae]